MTRTSSGSSSISRSTSKHDAPHPPPGRSGPPRGAGLPERSRDCLNYPDIEIQVHVLSALTQETREAFKTTGVIDEAEKDVEYPQWRPCHHFTIARFPLLTPLRSPFRPDFPQEGEIFMPPARIGQIACASRTGVHIANLCGGAEDPVVDSAGPATVIDVVGHVSGKPSPHIHLPVHAARAVRRGNNRGRHG